MSTKEEIIKGMYQAVLEGKTDQARDFTNQSLEAGIAPLDAINKGLTPAIRMVGERFGRMEMFLPEMVASAEAMEAAVELLEPHFKGDEARKKGKVMIGSVQGDIHDIGKNIVVALLKVNNFEVIDIGRSVPSTDFVDKAIETESQIIGLSGLLTTSLPMMRDIIQMLEEDGVRDKFKVIIGGGPTSQDYADQIGADGYGELAFDAVQLCEKLVGYSA